MLAVLKQRKIYMQQHVFVCAAKIIVIVVMVELLKARWVSTCKKTRTEKSVTLTLKAVSYEQNFSLNVFIFCNLHCNLFNCFEFFLFSPPSPWAWPNSLVLLYALISKIVLFLFFVHTLPRCCILCLKPSRKF